MSRVRAHVLIEGRVQGVFFRDFARQHARSLGVTGWVRNVPDGRVEGLFEGDEDAVKALVRKVSEGPPYARVSHVDLSYEPYRGEFEGFSIVY